MNKSVVEAIAKILEALGGFRDCRNGELEEDEDEDTVWARLSDAGRVLRGLLDLNQNATWQDLGAGVRATKNPQLPPGWYLDKLFSSNGNIYYKANNMNNDASNCTLFNITNYASLSVMSNGSVEWSSCGIVPLSVYAALLNQAGVTDES
jgi:hypothetical protein